MEESEIDKNLEIQDGGTETVTSGFLPAGTFDGSNTKIQRRTGNLSIGPVMELNDIVIVANRFNSFFYNRMNSIAKSTNPLMDLPRDSLPPGATGRAAQYYNKPLFLSDLLDLNNADSDISRIFRAIPIAQFKHLPDPEFLKLPTPYEAGQYDLSTNPVNETSSTEQVETVPETSEELPSLEVEEPLSGGASKSRKWSSHKKRRHTRIRTKKNKKL